ncbi:conserved hypothetical protein [Aspergillus udagawae]|uniref:Uncharacterized protein n=1 Tax=Aspergillus udagawae TaxID=91492 RepID=A0ABQ1ACG1_9EURO|nr:conserved hypothetical protein [Aspergillus udagawae]GFG11798.1 conserved hypothetical protein [Aspergillus udagawae]GFG24996.1 conserved hypothetical protein [Aspergillus udagawae]
MHNQYFPTRTCLLNPDKALPGDLVIVCTWLGASAKHITKYTGLHRSIAPHARILLIEFEVSIPVSSYARQHRLIQPAVDVVLETWHSYASEGNVMEILQCDGLSLPPSSRLMGSVTVHFLLILLYTWIACGNENPASHMRRTLLDEETDHAQEAKEKGCKVDEVLFKGTSHCAYMPDDPARYAEAVDKAWNLAVCKVESKL